MLFDMNKFDAVYSRKELNILLIVPKFKCNFKKFLQIPKPFSPNSL